MAQQNFFVMTFYVQRYFSWTCRWLNHSCLSIKFYVCKKPFKLYNSPLPLPSTVVISFGPHHWAQIVVCNHCIAKFARIWYILYVFILIIILILNSKCRLFQLNNVMCDYQPAMRTCWALGTHARSTFALTNCTIFIVIKYEVNGSHASDTRYMEQKFSLLGQQQSRKSNNGYEKLLEG